VFKTTKYSIFCYGTKFYSLNVKKEAYPLSPELKAQPPKKMISGPLMLEVCP
jgi:hypothetical protein